MATRSYLAIQLPTNRVKYSYVHWDGYPPIVDRDGVGDFIKGWSYKKLLGVINRGGMSSIVDLGRKDNYFTDMPAQEVSDVETLIKENPNYVDYIYYMDLNGNFSCYRHDGVKMRYKGTNKDPLRLRKAPDESKINYASRGAITELLKSDGKYIQRGDLYGALPKKFRVGDLLIDARNQDREFTTTGSTPSGIIVREITNIIPGEEGFTFEYDNYDAISVGSKVTELVKNGTTFSEVIKSDMPFRLPGSNVGSPFFRPRQKPLPEKEDSGNLLKLESTSIKESKGYSYSFKALKEALYENIPSGEGVIKFSSPIKIREELSSPDTLFADERAYDRNADPEDAYALNHAISKDETAQNLAQYLYEELREFVKEIRIEVKENQKNYSSEAITTVKLNVPVEELSPKIINSIRDYISGQFSDGWGEGFEQWPYDKQHTSDWERGLDIDYSEYIEEGEEEYFYEDLDEYKYEKYTVKYYASFWYSNHELVPWELKRIV